MKVYIAAPFDRRTEIRTRRGELADVGIEVTSRWIDIADDVPPDHKRAAAELADEAQKDLIDIDAADAVILDTETLSTTGGMWVELGYALARSAPVIVVGPRRNVFCLLPQVRHCDTWGDAIAGLRAGMLS